MILRPMLVGVTLILFRQRNDNDNVSSKEQIKLILILSNVDERRQGTKDSGATMTHFVYQFDRAEGHMKSILVVGGIDVSNLFVPLQ
jgi:hypothetical protein